MGSGEYRTPIEVWQPWDDEFDFNVDAAATPINSLVGQPGRYYTRETDGADQNHYTPGDRVWCNPPYDGASVARFLACAAETSKRDVLWALLLNASITDTRPFHRYVWDKRLHRPREGVEVRFREGRIAFLDEQGVPQESPRYANMLVVFHPPEATP